MKTIEERAKANLPYEQYFCGHSLSENMVCRAYVRGATEQKAIDIDKACEWLEKELQKIAVDEVKENFLENNFNIILKSQVLNWLTNFRKAMEE